MSTSGPNRTFRKYDTRRSSREGVSRSASLGGGTKALLIGADINVSRGRQMTAGQSHQFGAAATPQRLKHVDMVLFDALQIFRNRVRPGPDSIDFLRELFDRFDEVGIAT